MNIIETNLQFNGLSYGNNPKMLVLHHAEASNCTIQDIHQWHLNNGWAGCGYHFLVRKDGSIYRGRPESAIGAHCIGANATSFGICAEGNFMSEVMSDAQKNAIVELCKYLCGKYGIANILGHKELYATECPGTNYPLQGIQELILTETKFPSAPAVSTGILKLWSIGDAVKDLQQKLNKLGYSLNVDGIFGQNTFNAVEHFQASKGLTVDGEAGPVTLNALNTPVEFKPDGSIKQLQELLGVTVDGIAGPETLSRCSALYSGCSGDIVKWLQYCIRVITDGVFGNQTKITVQNYQASHGLAADGIVGQNTWRKLLGL